MNAYLWSEQFPQLPKPTFEDWLAYRKVAPRQNCTHLSQVDRVFSGSRYRAGLWVEPKSSFFSIYVFDLEGRVVARKEFERVGRVLNVDAVVLWASGLLTGLQANDREIPL